MNEKDAQKFLDENQGLLLDLANKFYLDTPKFSMEDLVQEANLAATRALKSFDHNRKGDNNIPMAAKISTYVYTSVKRGIRDFVRKNKHDLYVTPYQQNKDFIESKKRPQKEVVGAPKARFGTNKSPMALRMDTISAKPARGDENEVSMGQAIPSGDLCPMDKLLKKEQTEILREEVENLPDRERYIIEQKFFEGRHLADIAREQNVTRQRIEQISKRAMDRLRGKVIRRLDGDVIV